VKNALEKHLKFVLFQVKPVEKSLINFTELAPESLLAVKLTACCQAKQFVR